MKLISNLLRSLESGLILVRVQDGDRGGSEELAGGVLKYVEEKRRSDSAASCKGNEGIRLNPYEY